MLYRNAWEQLETWRTGNTAARKHGRHTKALMITGARQVGKTTLVREFGSRHYKRLAELNFLTDPVAATVFDGALDADSVTANLTAYLKTTLPPGETLVLLDEIQECPRARTAIKFLVEDGRFDYVETGSLLGVRTKEVPSYPVGFEESFRMYPLTFAEYCLANGVPESTLTMLREHFDTATPVSDAIHNTMQRLFMSYIVVGGMPEIVQRYVDTHDIAQVVDLQHNLLDLYRIDITKYADKTDMPKIRAIFDAVPAQLDDRNRRFVLADLGKTARQNRYASSFLWLADAGVTLPCYNVTAPTVPLQANRKYSLFKLFLADTGLLCASSMENVQFAILNGQIDINMGAIAENVVAQELAANGFALHYFHTKRLGEVDFVVQTGNAVLPIEVKSGRDWTQHTALDNVMTVHEWNLDRALVLCNGNLSQDGNVTYLPLYMTMFIKPPQQPASMPFEIDLSALR